MSAFDLSLEELSEGFHELGIPTEEPGFYDHPAFLDRERENPELLNHYAAFVAKRNYTQDYLVRAEKIIRTTAALLYKELVHHGRLGACVDISGILLRILDKEKIWNCGIKGSLTINYPDESRLDTRYFWSVDQGEFVAGHAWVFAPPFTVLDIASKQQPYENAESSYIPEMVLSTDVQPVEVRISDIVSPPVQIVLNHQGIPPEMQLEYATSYVPNIFNAVPPVLVPGLNGASMKYTPVAIHAPDGIFEDMRNMSFDGLTPWELYTQKIRSKIHE